MIKRLRYIVPALILLSLTALGDNIFIPDFCVKYSKETQWVTQASSAEKISKCFDYTQHFYSEDVALHLNLWSNEIANSFSRKVHVKTLLQTNILYHIRFKNRLFITLNIPGKFIEETLNSINQSDWLVNDCLLCPGWHDKNRTMCNSLLYRKWNKQQIKTFVYSKELNDFQKV